MTLVHVRLMAPDGSPARGFVECAPTRRHRFDDRIVLPAAMEPVELDQNGEAILDLAPSTHLWVWRIREYTHKGITRYVSVPANGPVEYADLPDVDPSTLEPTAEPEPTWWLALQDVQAGQIDPGVVADAVDNALADRLSSGGSVHHGEGPPPDFIPGARVGDVYIDATTGGLYTLGG